MTLTLFDVVVALLDVFEGPPRLTAFLDGGGVWTIGRGHTEGVMRGTVITRLQCDEFLCRDLEPLVSLVTDRPMLQAAAMVSFGYNCGIGSLKAVLAGTDVMSNSKFTRDHLGQIEPGLVSRRDLELVLCAISTVPPNV